MNKPLALIIEDDIDLAQIYSIALRGGGFDTQIIHDGLVASDQLGNSSAALIVLDLHLPHIGGVVLLKQIRMKPHLAKIPVIVTTADAQLGEDVSGLADLVLLKPVSLDQLRELAKRMLPKQPA
jgi:DNA-binding response OmpR family regulator